MLKNNYTLILFHKMYYFYYFKITSKSSFVEIVIQTMGHFTFGLALTEKNSQPTFQKQKRYCIFDERVHAVVNHRSTRLIGVLKRQ